MAETNGKQRGGRRRAAVAGAAAVGASGLVGTVAALNAGVAAGAALGASTLAVGLLAAGALLLPDEAGWRTEAPGRDLLRAVGRPLLAALAFAVLKIAVSTAAGTVPDAAARTWDYPLAAMDELVGAASLAWSMLLLPWLAARAAWRTAGRRVPDAWRSGTAWLGACTAGAIFVAGAVACAGKEPPVLLETVLAAAAAAIVLPAALIAALGGCGRLGADAAAALRATPRSLACVGLGAGASWLLPPEGAFVAAPFLGALCGAWTSLRLPASIPPAAEPAPRGAAKTDAAAAAAALCAMAVAFGFFALGPNAILPANDGGRIEPRDLVPSDAAWILGLSWPSKKEWRDGDVWMERLEADLRAGGVHGAVFIGLGEAASLSPRWTAPTRGQALAARIGERVEALTGRPPVRRVMSMMAGRPFGWSLQHAFETETMLIDDGDRRLAVSIRGESSDAGELLRLVAGLAADRTVDDSAFAGVVASHEAGHALAWLAGGKAAPREGASASDLRRSEETADIFAALEAFRLAGSDAEREAVLSAAEALSDARILRLVVAAGASTSLMADLGTNERWMHYTTPGLDAAVERLRAPGAGRDLAAMDVSGAMREAERIEGESGSLSAACPDGLAAAAGARDDDARTLASAVLARRLPFGIRRGANPEELLDPDYDRSLYALGWPRAFLDRARKAYGRMRPKG